MAEHGWTSADLTDLTGQRWLITGATNGIGLETARQASRHGAHITLAARDVDRGAQVARALGAADVLHLDLADLKSVRTAAAAVSEVDVLINNAGTSTRRREETAEGFELQLGVNAIAPFEFTNLVLPRVRRRVVLLGSTSHRQGHMDFDDPHYRTRTWKPSPSYAQSKLGTLLWGAELSRRVTAEGRGVDVQIAHPGWAATNMGNPIGNATLKKAFGAVVRVVAQPAERAAWCSLYAATQPLAPGSYVGPDGPGEMRGHPTLVERSKDADDPALAQRFWEFLAREAAEH